MDEIKKENKNLTEEAEVLKEVSEKIESETKSNNQNKNQSQGI